jgi:hypothetical protein
VHTVIETPTYLSDAKTAGLLEEELDAIASAIAEAPRAGDLIPGTGGAYKRRFRAPGRGKSGGYRVISYYAAADVPVFLLALVHKGQRADLSQAERNALKSELQHIADDYRAGVKMKVRKIGRVK